MFSEAEVDVFGVSLDVVDEGISRRQHDGPKERYA